MPLTTEQIKARRAADPDYDAHRRRLQREWDKRRKAKMKADPAYRLERKEKRRAAQNLRRRSESAQKPFTGCDGEGVKRKDGRSDYVLFRMGERELYRRGRRLTTPELLDFICRHPRNEILTGFAFEYDISNILEDVAFMPRREGQKSRLEYLLGIEDQKERQNPKTAFWTWLDFDGYPTFGVNYRPRNHLKVTIARRNAASGRLEANPAWTRTIFEAFGNFQSSFVAALKDRKVGEEHWPMLEKMKAQRSDFSRMTREHRHYNKIECELLAAMMEKFRADCIQADIVPLTWNGAGKLASAMHRNNQTMRQAAIEATISPAVLDHAHQAYYGGRFECTHVGLIDQEVWALDINSAYPAAMVDMPCLEHGKWIKTRGADLANSEPAELFVAPVEFAHPRDQFLCGLPFRNAKSEICWPRFGRGVYWSPEIRSAERLGATVKVMAGYRYEKRCDCQPLAWVADAYQERVKLGKDGAGLALKFGINALYGKFAQRIGAHPYQNPIWAGLITAITRAKLNDAIVSAGQQNVIMIATDAVFVVGGKPSLDLDAKRLGAWSAKTYPKLFIVRPGLYWAPGKLKSRGISPKFFTVINEDGSTHDVRDDFEHAWKDYARHAPDMLYGAGRSGAVLGVATFGEIARPPIVTVNVDVFVGLRLAYRRGDLLSACQWQSVPRKQSFDWRAKRSNLVEWHGLSVIMWPKDGSPSAVSHAYHAASAEGQGLPDGADQWEVDRMLFEAMPDADMYLVNEP